MSVKQQCQTIGLDLQRAAHYLLEKKPKKAKYYKNEALKVCSELPMAETPEKIKKVLQSFNIEEIGSGSRLTTAENYLTIGSILSLRASTM